MAWDSVPWFVGGGAQHSPEVARLLAYGAFRGNEGIFGPLDLQVKATTVPGSTVTIDPGACTIITRSTGEAYQTYVGRLASQDATTISATGGSARSDLIIARVEDPYAPGEPWSDPADPTVGPYIFTRRIPGVPNTTTDVASLGLGYSAIPLARIDIPASTGTITQAMIKDLRKVANPRRERGLDALNLGSTVTLTNTSGVEFPSGAHWSIAIPAWATQCKIVATWSNVVASGSSPAGSMWVTVGSVTSQSVGFGGSGAGTVICGDTIAIPAAMRGTTQTATLVGHVNGGGMSFAMNNWSSAVFDFEFNEVASTA